MNAASVMPRTGFKFMLIVRQGPDKGAVYQLLPPKVTIGRGPDNHVTLSDPKVSRQAAIIEFSMEKIVITDVSSRESLHINGEAAKIASIRDGDGLKLGETELSFVVEAIQMPSPGQAPTPSQVPARAARNDVLPFPGAAPHFPTPPGSIPPPPSGMHRGPQRSSASAPKGDDSGKMRFYIIVLTVAGLLYWVLSPSKAVKKEGPGLRTTEEVEREVKTVEERVDDLEKKRAFKSDEEKTRYEEAQKHYLEGFRDYSKGQWLRSMKSFETARAIDPDHQLALRYYRLAEKKRDEMVAMLILEGRQYKEKSMYPRCSAAFEKVLDAIPNKDDLKYKQAEAMKKECDLLYDERFK